MPQHTVLFPSESSCNQVRPSVVDFLFMAERESHNGFLVLLLQGNLSRRMVASRRVSSTRSLFDAVYLYQRCPPNNPPAFSTLFSIATNLNPYKSVFDASASPYFCTPIFTCALQGTLSLPSSPFAKHSIFPASITIIAKSNVIFRVAGWWRTRGS
jgi:hypothetical protein